jgi:PAS domain S-box-containing protein
VFGLAWIGFTDRALVWLDLPGTLHHWVAAGRSALFVLVSALLVYWLLQRGARSLARTDALLRAFTAGTTDAMFVKDRDGKYVLVNGAAANFVGRSEAEVLGLDDAALYSPESARRMMDSHQRIMTSGTGTTEEAELTAAGVTRKYLVTLAPDRDTRGNVIGVIGIGRDITDLKRVEGSLRESEQRFRHLADHAPMMVSVTDPDGGCTFLSRSWYEFTGEAPDAGLGFGWLSAVHPDDRDLVETAFRTVALRREDCTVDYRLRHRDVAFRWVLHSTVPRFGPDGALLGSIGSIIDFTERKEAEEKVRTSEAFLRMSQQVGKIGSWQWDVRTNRVHWSEAMFEIYGLCPGPVEEAMAVALHETHPDDIETVQAYIEDVTDAHGPHTLEYRIRRPDGRVAHLWGRTEVTYDATGTPVQATGTVQEISEQKLAEQALRTSEKRYAGLVNNLDGIVWEVDARTFQFGFVSPQAERILGYPVSQWIEEQDFWPNHIHPDDRERAVAYCVAQTRQSLDHEFEYRMIAADGRAVWLHDLVSVEAVNGEVVTLRGVMVDITDRKRAEETRLALEAQLRQAQKMEAVGRLAGGIAHDFNNILTVINGHSDFLLTVPPGAGFGRESLAAIRDAGERAARLTQQLLAFSRKAMVEPRLLDLNELVSNSAKLLRRLIGEDVLLTLVADPALGLLRADPGQLEQVLMNLGVNARDAMPTGGRLTLETRSVTVGAGASGRDPNLKPGRYAQLSVTDTGHGMSEEVKGKIFEPFFTTKGVGKGTGLGLAVVHGVVEQCGGHIRVDSAVGRGTTFELLFPVAEQPPDAPAASGAYKLVSRGTETVLLVEDEEAVRTIARLALETQGYRVLVAASGQEALRLTEGSVEPIHLVVTDVVMPGMGGRLLAEALRKRRPQIRVLYMSGYNDDAILQHGVSGSHDAFLQKPFTPLGLARKVRAVLDAPA